MLTAPISRRLRRVLIAAALVTTTAATSTVAIEAVSAVESTVGTTTTTKSTFVYGEKVTVTAAPTRPAKTAAPTGSVEFDVDGTIVTVALNSGGKALYTSAALAVGDHNVSAIYSGDARYSAGSLGSVSFSVVKGDTTSTLTSLGEPVPTGTRTRVQHVTKRVAPAVGSLLGTVTFTADNGVDAPTVATVPTNSIGTALWQPLLPKGSYTVSSVYSGNDGFNGSAPASVVVNVTSTGTLDVDNTGNGSAGGGLVYSSWPDVGDGTVGQTFIAGRSGYLDAVSSSLHTENGATAYPVRFSIRKVVNGLPTATEIGYGIRTPDGSGDMRFLPLTVPAKVMAGTTYALVYEQTSTSNFQYYRYGLVPGTAYQGGTLVSRTNAGPWQTEGQDLLLRTYIRP